MQIHRCHLYAFFVFLPLLVTVLSPFTVGQTPPNFLIIMADDCTFNDLPCYGGQNARTPNLDRLAKQSLVFDRAYLSEAMCQPCRAELYSGLYPMTNGCAWNHSASRANLKSMPQHLQSLGYRVGLAGKVHVKPDSSFPFEKVEGFDKNCVRNPTRPHSLAASAEFMKRSDQPFCLVVALVEPHVPWVMGDASKYPPRKIQLPPNIADTPRTRQDFGKYLAEITFMDRQVGGILDALEQTGKSKNTLVMFTSEQGSQFPGCKWTNWDTGVHTAMMIRWPGKTSPGRTDAIVQYNDVLPTFVEIAGENRDEQFDGSSFLPILKGTRANHRRFAFGCHNNVPEGPPFPIRTVSDGRFRYIRNPSPDQIYIEKHLMGSKGKGELNNPYWATWMFQAWEKPATYELVKRYIRRPAEQLYDTSADPYEMKNLAEEPAYLEIKNNLRRELDAWMTSQGDPGVDQDSIASLQAAKQGQHRFGPFVESKSTLTGAKTLNKSP